MMKRLNKAFTLTELLVALGVIAVLCAVLMPIIFNSMPNQNILMAKRAYYATQTVVSDLINNETCYPDKTSSALNRRIGFDDGFGYPNCTEWNESTYITTEQNAEEKFAYMFLSKISALHITKDNTLNTHFFTSDNMAWHFEQQDGFHTSKADEEQYALLIVDVNGDEAPNKGQSAATKSMELGTVNATSSTFDRFAMRIYADGKIEIDEADTWAIDAVTVNKDITSTN